jgi:hypothetical protein
MVSCIAFAVVEGLYKININPLLITNSGAIKSVSLERFIISKIPVPKRSVSPVKILTGNHPFQFDNTLKNLSIFLNREYFLTLVISLIFKWHFPLVS